jgi:hypothetical protein
MKTSKYNEPMLTAILTGFARLLRTFSLSAFRLALL